MEQPLLSIIIPAYNAEKFIGATIESLFRQDYSPMEIIVVNDGSTDNTLSALEKFGDKITVITQENKRQSGARNNGLRHAKGELVGMIDADDVWPDNHASLLAPYLSNDSEYGMVRGMTQFFREVNGVVENIDEPTFFEPVTGACLYKMSAIKKVGFFDETMLYGEDMDWELRRQECGIKEKKVKELALFYRRHENNETNSSESIKIGQMSAIKRKLERARNNLKTDTI